MNRSLAIRLCLFLALVTSSLTSAQNPDFTGTWVGQTWTIHSDFAPLSPDSCGVTEVIECSAGSMVLRLDLLDLTHDAA